MKKRFLALLLAAIMVVSLVPTTVFAGGGESYAITNGTPESAKETNHGYIVIDKATAAKGETVTITVKPNEGYQLKSLTVTLATLKAVYDTTGDANTLTFYYDVVDHKGDNSNITVYDNLPTAATKPTDWGYNSNRGSVKSVVIDSSVADYKDLTSTAYMFQGMTNAGSINGEENLDVSNVTNMVAMFLNFGSSITTLNAVPNVANWNTEKVTDMSYMFQNYGNGSTALNTVPNVANWNTEKVENMSYMFRNYGSSSDGLNVVPDVSKWNTEKVTNMSYMFGSYGSKSKVLDKVPVVSNWKTGNVTNMSYMFDHYGCRDTGTGTDPIPGSKMLNEVPNVANWNTANVTNMSCMFRGYGRASTVLNKVPNVSNWNTVNVTNMAEMFSGYGKTSTNISCELDLSGWDLSKITGTNGNNVFAFNPKTFDVKIPAKTGEKSNEGDKWYYGDGTNFITTPEGKSFTPPAPAATTFKAVYNTKGGANALTFYYDNKDHSGEGITVYEDGTTNYLFDNSKSNGAKWGYNSIRSSVKSVKIDSSVADYKSLTSTTFMFQDMTTATNISGAEYLDVSNVTDMSYMFQNFGGGKNSTPTTLNVVPDVSKWNTGNVTNMSGMFKYYGNLSSLLDKVPDVSNWNTGNVTDMSNMFQKYGHESQNFNAVPDVSKWNTGNVTNMTNMFNEYGHKSTALNTVPDVSKWNTASVKSMDDMFIEYGSNSTVLNTVPDVSKWNTGNVTTMLDMFQNFGNGSVDFVLDLSGWDLSKITGTKGVNVFNFNPKTFDVKIPAKTGEKSNEGGKWYYGDGTNFIAPPEGKSFTPPAPEEYTVTFNLNGITGTAPTSQTIKDGEKVTMPDDPTDTDTVHTFAGWYKTKNSTGALSDPWDFNNDTVTANMTLYAQWTRKISTIVGTTTDIPTVDNDLVWSTPSAVSIPEDAWIAGEVQSAFWVPGDDSGLAMLYTRKMGSGTEVWVFGLYDTDTFTKVDDTYVYSTEYGTATCTMTDGKLTSMTFAGNDLSGSGEIDFGVFSGTYAAPVKYMVWDETNKQLVEKKTSDFIEVTNPTNPFLGDLTLKAGKIYVVKGKDIERGTITVNGTIDNPTTLIICDGAKLTAGSIFVASGKALVITGQSGCTGELEADGNGYAGIGGKNDGGNITINGGKITAIGGGGAAAIGGGDSGAGGTITINGGVVNANGGTDAAAIGGGYNGNGGTVTINGGTVTATGSSAGAGIGGGLNGDGGIVTINDGIITATGGTSAAGIGGGNKGNGGTVTINGGTVTASGGSKGPACGGAGIGGGYGGNGASVTINGGKVTATGGNCAAGIGGGQFNFDGTTGKGGNGGTVIINGGSVTATGGEYAPGIGCGGGIFDETEAVVKGGAGGTVTINGGSVEAVAGKDAEAIGKGLYGTDSGTVTFEEGVNFTINAGADKDNTSSKTTTEYAGDHSAAYVSIEEAAAPKPLKSPAPKLFMGSAPVDPKTITPAKQDDGTYQFTMPAANVIVTAEFEAATPTHNPVLVNGQAATETDAGYKSYYECTHCKKYYEDATGLIEITDLAVWKSKNGNGYIPSGNEINAAKTAAKAALDSENAKDALLNETALTNGKSAIDSAETLADIENAKNAAITAIQEAQATELAGAKTSAKSALDTEEAKDPLTDKTALMNGKNSIDSATTKAAVESAKNAALEAIRNAQNGNALAAAQTAAQAALDAENAKDPLTDASSVTTGKENISKATTPEEVAGAKNAAITAIQTAQATELASARTDAKAALDAEDAKAPLTDKAPVTTGKANIDAAATKAAVESAKNAAIKAIQDAQANKPYPTPNPTPNPTPEPTPVPEDENKSGATEEYKASVESDEDSVQVSANITNGVATIEEIDEALLKEMFAKDASATEDEQAAADESCAITINLSESKQSVEGVELTKETVENLADIVGDDKYSAESVVVEMGEATVELDAKALEAIRDTMTGDTIRLVVERNTEKNLNGKQKKTLGKYDVTGTFDAYLESNGVRIHDFKGGNVTVSIEFTPEKGKKTKNYKVYYIDDKGKLQKHATKYEDGKLTFVTGHFSDYVVIYDNVQDVLLTEAATTKKGYIKLSWNEIDGAVKYVVYGAKCGKSYKELAETDGTSFTIKKISDAKPVSGKTYKIYVVAYDALGNKIKSKAIHYIAGDVSGKYANVEAITPLVKTLELTVGEKVTVGAEYAMYENKKHTLKKHGKALRFTSDCSDVAKVSSDGTVTAKSEGTAVIYIQDISGKWCQVEVTVK